MPENRYDDETFFEKYSQMPRSAQGLSAAGEWPTLQKMLPDFAGKRVLDLGCGYGWHCAYAAEHGAVSVTGVDISEKMLAVAREKAPGENIRYIQASIEEINFPPQSFDVVLSSLAFHYIENFPALCQKVFEVLAPGGQFIFSVEHPVFTASGPQNWLAGDDGTILCWPVDNYFYEGERTAVFLGEEITKYHRSLTTYVNALFGAGFALTGLAEPQPTAEMRRDVPGMEDEMRRPMMLILAAQKPL